MEKPGNIQLQEEVGVLEELRTLVPFAPFTPDERRFLSVYCSLKSAGEGEVLIREGDPSDNRAYFLLSGEVSVYVNEKFILSLGRKGDIFGEMSLVSAEPRSATVRATRPCRLMVVTSPLTFHGAEEESLLSYRLRYYFTRMFSNIMAEKLRTTSDRAKMYEEAIAQSRQAEAHSASLEETVAHNLEQIRLYSHLVESANDAILLLNLDRRVRDANQSLHARFGLDTGQVVMRSIKEVLLLPPGMNWDDVFAQADTAGWSGEVEVGTDRHPAGCSISLVADTQGNRMAYSVILHDIRARKEYEARILHQQAELEKSYKELQVMDRLKTQFLTLVSHELRTPISIVMGSLEVLAMPGDMDPADEESFLQSSLGGIQRLASLVDRVMMFSKLESGEMPFDLEEGVLPDLVRAQINACQKQAEEHHVRLVYQGPESLPPCAFDHKMMAMALDQVLHNAVKFSPKGEVTVSLEQTPEETLIRVRDTGKGIEIDRPERLLNKFEHMASTRDKSEGIGLGLPLTHLIVRGHQGSLDITSQPGQGTAVTFHLPCLSAADAKGEAAFPFHRKNT
ncbi:MAG: ATP-binding protein [Deltaproteobacteria bacterium]|nr:ATP-binding protein [Deltaproteobacteria bacterium]